jgi:hypothetical protein
MSKEQFRIFRVVGEDGTDVDFKVHNIFLRLISGPCQSSCCLRSLGTSCYG